MTIITTKSGTTFGVRENKAIARHCKLRLFSASKHDVNNRYATFSVIDAINNGFYDGTFEQFKQEYSQGDVFQLFINSTLVNAKINRATCLTAAFNCPPNIPVPQWNNGASEVIEVEADVIAASGLRMIPKQRNVTPSENKSPYPNKLHHDNLDEFIQKTLGQSVQESKVIITGRFKITKL